MDRFEQIQARQWARKQKAVEAWLKGNGVIFTGKTAQGRNATWVGIGSGMTAASRNLGTFYVDGETIFTRGSLERAVGYMQVN
jgi:hypothetical protein